MKFLNRLLITINVVLAITMVSGVTWAMAMAQSGLADLQGVSGSRDTDDAIKPQAPQDDVDTTGNIGSANFSSYVRHYDDATCPADSHCSAEIACSGGRKVLGGGLNIRESSGSVLKDVELIESFPAVTGGRNKWMAMFDNQNSRDAVDFRIYVICAYVD